MNSEVSVEEEEGLYTLSCHPTVWYVYLYKTDKDSFVCLCTCAHVCVTWKAQQSRKIKVNDMKPKTNARD